MVLTLPIGRRKNVILAWTRHGLHFTVWRSGCGDLPPWDDSDGSAGVREPRVPRRPMPGGAIALPKRPS